jgi:hypothetical protein
LNNRKIKNIGAVSLNNTFSKMLLTLTGNALKNTTILEV